MVFRETFSGHFPRVDGDLADTTEEEGARERRSRGGRREASGVRGSVAPAGGAGRPAGPTAADHGCGGSAHVLHLGGALRVLVGDEVTVLGEGDFLAVPPHTPHAFAAAPGFTADVLFVFDRRMDRFAYLRLLGRVMRGEADPQEITESAERFDNHYVESAAWQDALKVG
ncbi:cupin domain-containing protein [Streptomyces sp. QL37]|uniref:cupin domain-containing protein n=1 Tax=Streptomyces sp. QL37 TaxID=2093747 RepID=UPI0021CB6DC5|nr:cupin domain-containing protein [Streptomyces sp. QL37]